MTVAGWTGAIRHVGNAGNAACIKTVDSCHQGTSAELAERQLELFKSRSLSKQSRWRTSTNDDERDMDNVKKNVNAPNIVH